MSDAEKVIKLLEQIVASITTQDISKLPLWDSGDIAQYLRRSQQVVTERIVCLPDFPPAIRINNGRPLWEAKEVSAWALSFKETQRKGRPRKATMFA